MELFCKGQAGSNHDKYQDGSEVGDGGRSGVLSFCFYF
jgi:hypothetical protein